jgi:hypothetical protein
MAFNSLVDDEGVRKAIMPSTRKGRRRNIRALNTKKS